MSSQPVATDYAAWRDRLAEANDQKFWPIHAIDSMLISGNAQFWCDGQSALVTKIVEYPGGAVVLESVAATGCIESLRDVICAEVEEWAREQKMTHLLIAGRPGWARVHKGWRHHQSILIKGLADG